MENSGSDVTTRMFQTMQDVWTGQKQKPLSIDDTVAMLMNRLDSHVPMDKEIAGFFRQLKKVVIAQTGKKNLQELDKE